MNLEMRIYMGAGCQKSKDNRQSQGISQYYFFKLKIILNVIYLDRNVNIYRSSFQNKEAIAQRCSVKNALFEILQNSQESTYARVSFLIKLQPETLLKKKLWHRCFPPNFAKFQRTPFLTEHLRWLLLKIIINIYEVLTSNIYIWTFMYVYKTASSFNVKGTLMQI